MSEPTNTTTLAVLPIRNAVLFPHLVMPLSVGRPTTMAAVEQALQTEEKTLLIVSQKDSLIDTPQRENLFAIGTKAVIRKFSRLSKGLNIVVTGIERVRILEMVSTSPFLQARVVSEPVLDESSAEVEALSRSISEMALKLQELTQTESPASITEILAGFKDPLDQVYLLSSILSMDVEKEQALLEAETKTKALSRMHDYLSHELQVQEIRQKIASKAERQLTKQQREILLRQQLQAIQEELGEGGPEQSEVLALKEKAEKTEMPDAVKKEVDREIAYLERLSSMAGDYQVTRSHIELVLELPWKKKTEDILDLDRAKQVLDEDHFDLKQVKERILEELAVLKMNPIARAPILCLVGPPGTGKTSIGHSIARSLGRMLERMSLGGLHDESELRGHRRTYVGAMPGRVIQAIRRAGVSNPLLMLDEIDKVGTDFRGDPAAALMEILDPAQNREFRDNYLDLPFDLSGVFFVATANTLQSIPEPLLDRMEVISLSGYSEEEKLQIAKRYLLPRQLKHGGLDPSQWVLSDETLLDVIRKYTREAGLRQLERALGQLVRKLDRKLAEGQKGPIPITQKNLAEFLGPERMFMEKARKEIPIGVATGLAWTPSGGEVLYIESALIAKKSQITITGKLGKTMRESVEAALSYVWSHPEWLSPTEDWQKAGVHVHVPAGAIPKDGPSAGVAIVSALTSLYSRLPVRSDTAMTGEITLTGLVLPVGGIKEKVLAARRAGIRRVVLPKANEQDLSEIEPEVRKEIEFILVEKVEDALEAVIPQLSFLETRIAAKKAAAVTAAVAAH